LYPVYVRGEAYLAARKGREAAVEFQKILDHPGVVVNQPIGALAAFKSLGLTLCRAKPIRPKRPIRIFSPYGKTPILSCQY